MPLDAARWSLEITAADKTAAAFSSATARMKAFGDANAGAAKKSADSFSASNAIYEAISGKLKGLAAAAAAAVSVTAVIQKGKEIEDYALTIDKLAKSFKVSTIEAQALEAAARRTGKTAEELNTQLSANQKALLGQVYKSAFGDTTKILDDVAKASTRLSDAFSDMGEIGHNAMVATFGGITEVALNTLTDAIKIWSDSMRWAGGMLDRMRAAIPNPVVSPDEQLRTQGFVGNELPSSGLRIQTEIEKAADGAAKAQAELDRLTLKLQTTYEEWGANSERTQRFEEDIANLTPRIRELTAALGTLVATAAGMKSLDKFLPSVEEAARRSVIGPFPGGNIPGATEFNRIVVEGTKPKVTTTGGGSAGRSDNDSVDAQIKRYTALADVAKRAGETIDANRQKNIEDLQREVRVQEQVEEIAAKLGAKYSDADAARKQQLHDEIALYEQRKAANQLALESAKKAEDIEVKLGDGTRARTLMELDLTRAKDSGRVSTEALMRVEKQRSEELEHQSLQARRYDDDLGSLGAGFQDAASSYARANDMFAQGGQLFSGVTSAMGDGLDVLLGKSTKTFGQIASDFGMMLTKMALQAALSPVWKILGSAAGSALGGLFGGSGVTAGPAPAGGYGGYAGYASTLPGFSSANANGNAFAGGNIIPFARGGIVHGPTLFPMANGAGLMGEAGPEGVLPLRRGRGGRLGVDASGIGGGGDVIVNIINNNTGASTVAARKSKGPGGQNQVDIIVEAVEGKMSGRLSRGQGALGKTMEGTYGLQRVGR